MSPTVDMTKPGKRAVEIRENNGILHLLFSSLSHPTLMPLNPLMVKNKSEASLRLCEKPNQAKRLSVLCASLATFAVKTTLSIKSQPSENDSPNESVFICLCKANPKKSACIHSIRTIRVPLP